MAARSALSGLPLYAVMLSFAGWRLRLTRLTAATNRSTRRPAQAQRRRALFQAPCPIFSPVAAAPDPPTSLSLSRMAARSALSGLPDGLEP
ncbi:hypothetical protein KD913_03990 [Klebsiella pneumoniae]